MDRIFIDSQFSSSYNTMLKQCMGRGNKKPKYLFNPRITKEWREGGTLVVGINHWCIQNGCEHYEDCVLNSNSKEYDKLCEWAVSEVDEKTKYDLRYTTYEAFSCYFGDFLGYESFKEFLLYITGTQDCMEPDEQRKYWNRLAFYNYIQHFTKMSLTHTSLYGVKEALSKKEDEDFAAFLDVLHDLRPRLVIVWHKDIKELLLRKIADGKVPSGRSLQLVDVTVNWFEYLKGKYGKLHPRRTEIRNFDTIEVTKVVEANQKLYINRQEGFVGTGLKKDEFVCNCSDIDDIIVFFRDGSFKVMKVADKIFVGKNILHVQVFKKNDRRTIYNCVYRDGKQGEYYIKRFNVTAMTRDKMYDITQGTPGSRVIYFTANPNGEAEIIKVTLEPDLSKKRQNIFLEKDFSTILIKGRAAKGNLLTKRPIRRIGLKSHGHSTLGGRKVWFDPDVNRINYDGNGRFIGEFSDDESILVVLTNGDFYITNFDANNHYEDNILRIEKWDEHKVWTAVLYDADNDGYAYVKRFTMDATKRHQNFLGENADNSLILLSDTPFPRLSVTYGGVDAVRPAEEIDAEQFIGQKSFKAKGKRLTTWNVESVVELEPVRFPEPPASDDGSAEEPSTNGAPEGDEPVENLDPDAGKSEQQVIDELTGQQNLFSDADFD